MGDSINSTVNTVSGKGTTALVVNEESGEIGRMNGDIFAPVVDLNGIGENTTELEYRKWILKVFRYDPTITFMFLAPMLLATFAGTYFLYLQTGQFITVIFAVLIPFIATYNILIRMHVEKVVIVRKDKDSGDYFTTEDEFWLSDTRLFPKECFHLNQETGQWVPWIDARNGVRVMNPWASKQAFSNTDINASDVMGTESYLRTTFNIGNMRPKKSLFEEAAPNLMMIGIGCVATFLAADRIAEMLNIQ